MYIDTLLVRILAALLIAIPITAVVSVISIWIIVFHKWHSQVRNSV